MFEIEMSQTKSAEKSKIQRREVTLAKLCNQDEDQMEYRLQLIVNEGSVWVQNLFSNCFCFRTLREPKFFD